MDGGDGWVREFMYKVAEFVLPVVQKISNISYRFAPETGQLFRRVNLRLRLKGVQWTFGHSMKVAQPFGFFFVHRSRHPIAKNIVELAGLQAAPSKVQEDENKISSAREFFLGSVGCHEHLLR